MTLVECIRARSQRTDGLSTMSFEAVNEVASEYRLSRREAEIAVLDAGVMPRRYLRNYGTIGLDGQRTLLASSVAIVGLGGLGGYVCEGLARMGLGRLVLMDDDRVCDHNLNRQLFSLESNLTMPKTEAAAERVRQVNSATELTVRAMRASADNLGRELSDVQVLVDAVDRLPTRLMLQEVANRLGIPLIHGAIAGWLGQVMTILPGDPGLRSLYADGERIPEQGAEVELGTPPASPMMVAAWQVHETVKYLLGKGTLLTKRMLFMDAGTGEVWVLGVGG